MKPYEHKAQYYETDQMGIIHHSNYIRWFESARIDFMSQAGVDYADMEKEGIISPVLTVSCKYRSMVHFGDVVLIEPEIRSYNGVKLCLFYTVQDKVTGRLDDFLVSPVPKSALALGYYISTALVTFAVCGVALVAGFIYLAIVGWYMSAADVFLALLDTFLLVMFGTALSSLVCSAIKSQGGISAVQVIISAAYGFFCGAYMPIGSISEWLSSILKFFPGTYGTMLLHEHFMGASIDAMPDIPGLKDAVRLSFDCKVEFFGHAVAPWVCYLVIALSTLLIAGAYVLLLSLKGRKKKQSQGKLMDGKRLNI